MIQRDMPEVLRIEAASFDVPWDKNEFIEHLKHLNCIAQVAECDDWVIGRWVIGYVVYELEKHAVRIVNLAVHPAFRRHGVGRQLVDVLIRKLGGRRWRIVEKVRETNLPAQLFFSACGFRATGIERAAFWDSDEDAYVMEYRIQKGNTL